MYSPIVRALSAHLSALFTGCECNNHAQSCHFDQALYEASGRRSGGVCEGCLHHTMGPKCDQCAPGYQPNPRSQMDRPDACIRKWFKLRFIWSWMLGPSHNTVWASWNSSFRKTQNICYKCLEMSNVDPLLLLAGCICSAEGSVNGGLCDDRTVSCQCKANVEGPRCDRCKRGYYGLSASNPLGCSSELSNTDISLWWINHFFSLIFFKFRLVEM